MKNLLGLLALVFAYNKNRQQRIHRWGKKRYDGTTKPWL